MYFTGVEILTPIQRVPRWWIGESTSRYGVLAANTRIIYSISSPEPKIREIPWQYLLLCCHPHQGYGTNIGEVMVLILSGRTNSRSTVNIN